jgi:ATP-dependent RNA helicase DDX51/DBP6
VEWLVIDEADRLLDSNFQDWVDIVLPALETVDKTSPKTKVLATLKEKASVKQTQKVILSATMTRDLGKLASLKLNRPTLVAVVEPEKNQDGGEDEQKQDGHAAILPATLKESAVPVSDGSEKPLYLLQLLEQHLGVNTQDTESVPPTALVFCASDDNATRLARLLALLSPSLEARTAVLTKSITTSSRRKILTSFGKPGGIVIVISTDRTSRGLDVDNLSYVVNYDIPPSVTSYVHRVGRTARAGRDGESWTLVTDTEARWFWRTIAKGGDITRAGRIVERVRLGDADDELKEAYQNALEKLGEAVRGR